MNNLNKNETKKIAIIGSGPAGYTAAIYTSRANIETTIYTGMQMGGQLTTTTEIENFPGFENGIDGGQLVENMQKQAVRFGAKIMMSSVQNIIIEGDSFKIEATNGENNFDAVIIASGATAKYLGIAGEEKYIGKGYHSCATCDGFFYRGKEIIVVGGGDSAMEEANFLTNFATKVYILNRSETFKASPIMLDRAKNNPKIEFILNSEIAEFKGEDKVEKVVIKNNLTGKKTEMDIPGVFVAIGHIPNTNFVPEKIEKDQLGYLIASSQKFSLMQQMNEAEQKLARKYSTITQIPGIFVAGDVTDHHYRQAITAAGMGCKAAMDAQKWLENHQK